MTENIDFDSEVWGDEDITLHCGFITEKSFFNEVVEKPKGENKWQELARKTMNR